MNLQPLFVFLSMMRLVSGNFWSGRNEADVCAASAVPAAPSSTSLNTHTPLVIDLSFPPSVKVDETFSLCISVYNVLSTSLPVSIEVEENSGYEVLTEPCSVCVSPNSETAVVVSIRAVTGGDTNIIVNVRVEDDYPLSCGGDVAVSKSYHIASPINIAFPGHLAERSWSVYICSYDLSREFVPLEGLRAPADIVPGSARAWLTLTGDLLGASLRNMDHLIRLPSGCGEQRMATHAPNIFILHYLNTSGQVTPAQATQLTNFIRSGYEYQRNRFRLPDGSYTFFPGRNGSTWLTAFVLKAFSLSSIFISVDPDDITSTKDWLKDQQLADGCFNRVGHVHNRRMQSLATGGSPGAMAAYVTISLLEALEAPDSPEIVDALACIESATAPGTEGAEDLYMLALKAYAYSLAGHPGTVDAVVVLLQLSSESDDGLFWRMNNYGGSGINLPLTIETTSYALLAILQLNLPDTHEETRQIVRWLITAMNSYGGFQSTQDTVMALQALAAFAEHEALEPADLSLQIIGAANEPRIVSITEINKIDAQRVDVERLPAYPAVVVEGSGCFVIQGALRYNIEADQPSEVFTLRVTIEPNYGAESCPAYTIKVCVAYHLVNLRSNMGMVEVTLVSGYSPVREDLDRIGSIQFYQVVGNNVILYFEEFTSAETCIEFSVIRNSVVANPQPGEVKAYDYYQPNFSVSKSFQFRRMLCSSG